MKALQRELLNTRGRQFSGVYCILNHATEERYIGSSRSLGRRYYNHKNQLRRGVNRHPKLQQAWNASRPSDFEFVVLEVVQSVKDLKRKEQEWMDRLLPQYNTDPLSSSAYGRTVSDKARENISLSATGRKLSPSSIAKREETVRERGWKRRKRTTPYPESAKIQASIKLRGSLNPSSRLTEEQVREIKRRALAGEVQQRIADEFNIPQARVSSIKLGKSWKHVEI